MLKKVLIVFVLCGSFSSLFAQDKKNRWIDSVFQTLNTREKIGQLFMLSVSSYLEEGNLSDLFNQIDEYHPGGIVITKGGPVGSAALIEQLQHKSTIPLLVGIDAEWGLSATLDSVMSFQKPIMIGAIKDDSLIYQLAAEVARQMKLIGIHINFAPNADSRVLANNPTPYISNDRIKVATKSIAFVQGMQDHGIMACAKYVPQTFETVKSSDLTSLDFNLSHRDSTVIFTYQKLIGAGIEGMLTSHLHFSTMDKKKSVPAPASQIFISDVLKQKMGFNGLTFTNIPHLHTLLGKAKGETEKLAFEIGNDILIDPINIGNAFRKIEASIKKNAVLTKQLDVSVRKILEAKYNAGLFNIPTSSNDNLITRLNSPQAALLNRRLAEASITVARNDDALVPIRTLENKSFASLSIGTGRIQEFEDYLARYAPFTNFSVRYAADTLELAGKLLENDLIIVSLYEIDPLEKENLKKWINHLGQNKKIIICSFGNPYDLIGLDKNTTIITSYTDLNPVPGLTAQVLFGTSKGKGVLPLTLTKSLLENQGQPNTQLNRLGFSIPENVGMDGETLNKIKAIVQEAIDSAATPGCNIVIARRGKVIFNEAFGWKTYDRLEPTQENTIYDLASITKVAATLQTVMFMHEKGLIDINKKASVYLPELKNSNKKDFTIKDIITHQAGLWPYLPFWTQTIEGSTLLPEYYDSIQSEEYPFPVADHVFAKKTMKDSLWHWIVNAKIREKTPRTPYNYTYSDMGFYIMQHLAEKLLNQPLEDFVAQNFYEPIGAYTTGFLPLERFSSAQIAPTEVDKTFRGSKLVGYVHDQGAAMHGGIAGHAGLFSDGLDLAKMGQMWLQEGSYGGQRYFKPETIRLFTTKQYITSRRGLGWDKPTVSDWNGPTSLYASPKTFGHTGFTGTAIWVDPEFDLVYVFLSNRVYPDMYNTKLLTRNIRPRIQDVIYESIFNYCKRQN